jgi:glycosyltransferase involved in cell wall biosynthesis
MSGGAGTSGMPARPLKVAHLVHNFPPEFEGGTERHVAALVRHQRELGLLPAVFCGSERRDDATRSAAESFHGVAVTRFFRRQDERFGVDFAPPALLAAVAAAVRAFAPDVVHLHHWFNLGDALLQALAPLPAVGQLHDAYAACPRFFLRRPDGFDCGGALPVEVERCVACIAPDDGAPDLAGRLAARRARFAGEVGRMHAVIAPSESHAELMAAAQVAPRARIVALPLGLPLGPSERPIRPPHRPAQGRLRVVHFGHLSRLKGVDLLLAAVRALAPRGVALDLLGAPVAGEEAELRRLADGLPVRWHGAYDAARLAAVVGDCDVAIFPSRARETFSFVVEEAIALGLPVVVSDRGAPARRVAGFGRVVAVDDAAPLVATLTAFLDRPETLAAMRAALPPTPILLADHARAVHEHYRAAIVAAAAPPGTPHRTTPAPEPRP